ncbi:MAG TPA: transketolase, partial [Ktedonobacterales bacterium]|nr:transketolase [Ktedonobacterales bacterium]
DRRVFALMGDGECNEGTIWESVLQAGNKHLGNLTGIFVNNFSSSLDLGDLAAKLNAFGWHAMTVDGRDHEQIYTALTTTDPARPTAVVALIQQ